MNAEVIGDAKEDAMASKSKSEAIETPRSEECKVGDVVNDEDKGHDEVLVDAQADGVAVDG
jgi:hypothetical protein